MTETLVQKLERVRPALQTAAHQLRLELHNDMGEMSESNRAEIEAEAKRFDHDYAILGDAIELAKEQEKLIATLKTVIEGRHLEVLRLRELLGHFPLAPVYCRGTDNDRGARRIIYKNGRPVASAYDDSCVGEIQEIVNRLNGVKV